MDRRPSRRVLILTVLILTVLILTVLILTVLILTVLILTTKIRRLAKVRLFAVALLLVLSACSADRTLDGDQLEAEISDQLLPQYPGALRSVSCPNSAEPAPGQRILCVASLNGGQVIDVNVDIGGSSDALTTTATIDARFVAINEVAALLGATFGDEIGLSTSVDCGLPILVLQVDDSVLCRATDPSGVTRSFDVWVDESGLVELDLR